MNNNELILNKNNIQYCVGIDVGKKELSIYVTTVDNLEAGEYKTIKNNEEEILKIINNLKNFKAINKENTLIIIDRAGKNDLLCRNLFYENNFNIILAEGKKVKKFKETFKDNMAKTDKIDSIILVNYVMNSLDKLKLYQPISNNREIIKELYSRLDDLKNIRKQEKARYKDVIANRIIKESINRNIEHLDREIEEIQKEIDKTIDKDDELKLIYNTLTEHKGIKNNIAYTLIAKLPELGKVNRRQIASIAGLAPVNYDSGTISKHKYVKGGRRDIKEIMGMLVMILFRWDKITKEKKDELMAKGKLKTLVITALARKILVKLNAIVRDRLIESGFIEKKDIPMTNYSINKMLNKKNKMVNESLRKLVI